MAWVIRRLNSGQFLKLNSHFMNKFWYALTIISCVVLQMQAQTHKNYAKYLDTVNARTEYSSAGPIFHLKRSAKSFGDIKPKPYHLVFNFNYDYIKAQFPVFMQEIERTAYLDSLVIDNQVRGSAYKKILYLGVDVPFAIQIAVIKALLKKIGIMDEVALLKKGGQNGETREVMVGVGGCSYVREQLYLRKFSNIRQLALAKNKAELIQIFETLNEGYSEY